MDLECGVLGLVNGGIILKKKWIAIVFVVAVLCEIGSAIVYMECEEPTEEVQATEVSESFDVKDYEQLSDIISIEDVKVEADDDQDKVDTYKLKYRSDDCEVTAYLSVPKECRESEATYPCIIYNRGGNRTFGANEPEDIAYMAATSNMIILASQYRGVDGGTGTDEFGGADVHDVIKLIDLCGEFAFVDMDKLYMMGISRGGMMTYEAIREDDRIQAAVVVSGVADVRMSYEERADMRYDVLEELIGGSPEELPEEYERRSATCWAKELKCPVLIIHSKLDEKVPYEQAQAMVSALEDAEMTYKLVTHEDDVHGLHPKDFETIMSWCSEK